MRRIQPDARHACIHVLLTQSGVVVITCWHAGERGQTAIHHQHRRRFVLAERYGFVQQGFVGHHLAAARTGIGADDEHRGCVVNARGQGMRGETAEHHRVNRAYAHTSQHGKRRFGNHWQVNQHPVALLHAQALHDGRHALHLLAELGEGVSQFLAGFGGHVNQRGLVAPAGHMPVHRVMADIGLPAHKPVRKRRLAVVANLLGFDMPVDQFRLLSPKSVAVLDGSLVKTGVGIQSGLRYLIKACTSLKCGCSALRSHSNKTISVVSSSAPAAARRS